MGRRTLERTLSQQIPGQRGSRFRHAPLLALDIDHFKDVIDRHGTAAGDAAQSDLAAIVRDELRNRNSARADAALYEAKRKGRNSAVIAG